ncbi:hypothetical protein [Mycolicibacterium senegalense]|nr:hypothetical protein [Mycolicibacterium senegalense]
MTTDAKHDIDRTDAHRQNSNDDPAAEAERTAGQARLQVQCTHQYQRYS